MVILMVSRQKKENNTVTRVYKYGLFRKDNLPKDAIDELFHANQIWNNLVNFHNENYKKIIEARCDASPEYAKLTNDINAFEELIKIENDNIRKARIKAKTTDNSHPDIVPIVEARGNFIKSKKDALEKRKSIKFNLDMKSIKKEFYNNVKEINKSYNGKVYSLTTEKIKKNFKTAREKVLSDPRKSRLNFHRFDGSGFYHFRCRQIDKSSNGAKWSDLFEGDNWNLRDKRLMLTGIKRTVEKKNQVKQWIGVKSKLGNDWVHFDLIYHRPIPDEGIITNGQIIRERIGTRFRYHLCITVDLPQSEPSSKNINANIGIDINWRLAELADHDNKTLKVAACVHFDHVNEKLLKSEMIYLPEKIQYAANHVKRLESELSESARLLGEKLKPELQKCKQEENKYWKIAANNRFQLNFETARKLKSDHDFGKVNLTEIAENLLNNWHQKYYIKYCEHHNLNKKYLTNRKHFYRNLAARLIKYNIPIAVENLTLSKMAEVKNKSNKLGGKSRGQRVHAAPSELLSALENVAKREGIAYTKVNPSNTSKTCHVCHTIFKEMDSGEHWECPSCGTKHDRDINAAINIAHRGYESLQKKAKNNGKN